MSMWAALGAMAASGVLGAIKAQDDKKNYAKKKHQADVAMAYSPWTGVRINRPDLPQSELGTILQAGLTEYAMAQQMNGSGQGQGAQAGQESSGGLYSGGFQGSLNNSGNRPSQSPWGNFSLWAKK